MESVESVHCRFFLKPVQHYGHTSECVVVGIVTLHRRKLGSTSCCISLHLALRLGQLVEVELKQKRIEHCTWITQPGSSPCMKSASISSTTWRKLCFLRWEGASSFTVIQYAVCEAVPHIDTCMVGPVTCYTVLETSK